jgi:hypothetical protein
MLANFHLDDGIVTSTQVYCLCFSLVCFSPRGNGAVEIEIPPNLFHCQHAVTGAFLTLMNSQVTVETATQLSVFLGNRPGALARVCAELAAAEINIHALATSDTIDHAVVRMVVSDPTKALMILGERGVLALENDVLMIESNNKPGTLGTIAERLARAGINIEYAYLASSPKSEHGLMILRPSNVEKAERALRDL